MPNKKVVGERLRMLRGSRTQAEVAKSLNVSENAVSLWERGKRMPSDTMKVKISTYFRKSVTAIFFRD